MAFVSLKVYPENFEAANKSWPIYMVPNEWEASYKLCRNVLVCMRSGILLRLCIDHCEKMEKNENSNWGKIPQTVTCRYYVKSKLKHLWNIL